MTCSPLARSSTPVDRGPQADAGPGRHGRRKADAVEAVVEHDLRVLDDQELVEQAAHGERDREHPVRDGTAEWPCRGAFVIDVDPLVILGRVGERVDARLRDLEPVGRTQVGTGEVAEIGQSVRARAHSSTRES